MLSAYDERNRNNQQGYNGNPDGYILPNQRIFEILGNSNTQAVNDVKFADKREVIGMPFTEQIN